MLLYVHQQIAIIQCSYDINSSESKLVQLVDSHKELKYKLASLKSPKILEQKLADAQISLVLPEQIKIVKVPMQPANSLGMQSPDTVASGSNLFQIFGFAREAQADTSQ